MKTFFKPLFKFMCVILTAIRCIPLVIILPLYLFFRLLLAVIVSESYEDIKYLIKDIWSI